MCARMSLFLRRFPPELYLTDKNKEEMKKNRRLLHIVKECKERCPYGLDIPTILEKIMKTGKTF